MGYNAMSIIDVMQEEIQNKQEWLKLIDNEVLAKATLKIKQPYNQKYYYLHYHENGKTIDKYLGKLSQEQVDELQHKIILAKHQKKKIPEVKKEIKFIQKVLDFAKKLDAKNKGLAAT